LLDDDTAWSEVRSLAGEPVVRGHGEQLCYALPLDSIEALLQLSAPRPFCVLCDGLAGALRRFADQLARESKLIPPHISALVDTHFDSPFFGGRPPNLPFSRAIAWSFRIPNRSSRAA
jgi:hypothetical protein